MNRKPNHHAVDGEAMSKTTIFMCTPKNHVLTWLKSPPKIIFRTCSYVPLTYFLQKKTFFSMKPTYFMVKILAIDPSSGCWAKANKVSTGSCGTPWASNVTCPHFVEDLINKLEVPKMGIPQNRYFLFDGKS